MRRGENRSVQDEICSDAKVLTITEDTAVGKWAEPSHIDRIDSVSREPEKVPDESRLVGDWTAEHVVAATGGDWLSPPSVDWSAGGLCIWRPSMQPGDMVAVRSENDPRGVPVDAVTRLPYRAAALIVSHPDELPEVNVPVLVVSDLPQAILQLGEYARNHMTGKVLAVTGSAGKTTTVAMARHALDAYGTVVQTAHNANLPYGVAWNLASMPWGVDNAVVELAIGGMDLNSKIARPDVAIVTNILPAHLKYHRDLKTTAERKSRIFDAMESGAVAVLNKEMNELEVFEKAAEARGLKIVYYGKSDDCDFQLVEYDTDQGIATVRSGSRNLQLHLHAHGEHMALNAIAVVAGVSALGLDPDRAAEALAEFQPLAGRGEEFDVNIEGRKVRVIDDAYNANPGSMKASISQLGDRGAGGRRVIAIGEMLELGANSKQYHTELSPVIADANVDRVYAVGECYADLWATLPEERKGALVDTPVRLRSVLRKELADGDLLLVKGSHGSEIHSVVDWLKSGAPRLAANIGAVLYDSTGSRIVYSQNENCRYPVASFAKLMTFGLVEEHLMASGRSGQETVTVSAEAADVNGRWGFDAGDSVAVDTLLAATIGVNANEATNALAEWHSGSQQEFTAAMNRCAADLGMRDTCFGSPSGLGADEWITPADALKLAIHIDTRYQRARYFTDIEDFSWKGKCGSKPETVLDSDAGIHQLSVGRLRSSFSSIVLADDPTPRIAIVLGARSATQRDLGVKLLIGLRE